MSRHGPPYELDVVVVCWGSVWVCVCVDVVCELGAGDEDSLGDWPDDEDSVDEPLEGEGWPDDPPDGWSDGGGELDCGVDSPGGGVRVVGVTLPGPVWLLG